MAKHQLEEQYGLTSRELLDAVAKRFRLRTAIEGAVAEVHMELQIRELVGKVVQRYESHDLDGEPDFSVWIPNRETPIRIEAKNVRDSTKVGAAYRLKGEIVAYKVETQKTRTSQGDPSSRYYGVNQFDVLGVCLGKKTGNWKNILYVRTSELELHPKYEKKLKVFQRVPLPGAEDLLPWYDNLEQLIRDHYLPVP